MSVLKLKMKNCIKELSFSGEVLLRDLLEREGMAFSPCGGKGNCGKCAVKIMGNISAPNSKESNLGYRLACQTVLYGDAEAELIHEAQAFAEIESQTLGFVPERLLSAPSVALDIGTTTLVLKLFSEKGETLATATDLNPQRSISSDVMGRISAAAMGKGSVLQQQIIDAVTNLIDKACRDAAVDKSQIESMVITGNTAMLYLLCGTDVGSIARFPFQAEELFGKKTEEPFKAYIPKCMNAFVGADITCGVLASGMCEKNKISLLCDVGTNGEIALWKNGTLYVTSTAAGPAFECAEISCGCGYILGAVDKVFVEKGSVTAHVVGDIPPKGICGSGLIDAVAVFSQLGYIDKEGTLASNLKISANGGSISINQDDLRNLQLAKSAIRSGMDVLLSRTETDYSDIQEFYLCGGFGSHISLESAAAIGLIPKSLAEKGIPLGNSALAGAAMLLFNPSAIEKTEDIFKNSVHIPLGGTEDFNNRFIENLLFP